MRVAGLLSEPVNANFESIFEVGVDEMLWDDMLKNERIWPTVSEVWQYRRHVYQTVKEQVIDKYFDDDCDGIAVSWQHPLWSVFMGMEHERIHMETSSVLFREMPRHLVQTPEFWPPLHPSSTKTTIAPSTSQPKTSHPVVGQDFPVNEMIAVDQSHDITLGKPDIFPSYGWDNEYGTRTVHVPPFAASQCMISNGEYWQFVADGAGYRTRSYWCDQGWAWRTFRNAKWPFFWQPAGPEGSHEYQLRTIFDIVPMPWDWPVDVGMR